MRQRRRAERSRAAQRSAPSSLAGRRLSEHHQQRLLIGAGVVIALVVAGLLIAGWYFGAYRPPRQVLADIDDQVITLADIVPYTILEGTVTGTLDPRQGFNTHVRDAIFRSRAGEMSVTVTPEEVEASLAARFEPVDAEDPDAPLPEALGPEGRENMQAFLDIVGVEEADYRTWVEGALYWAGLLNHFQEQVPETAEQVFLNWIVAENSVTVGEAYQRITEGGESFADVAAEFNTDVTFSDESGVVGWTPEGAFREFDTFLFGDNRVIGEPIGPLASTIGSVLLLISEGPEERDIEDDKASILSTSLFQDWMDVQTADLLPANPFTFEDASWVLERIQ